MDLDNITAAGIKEFKQILKENCKNIDMDELTPDTYLKFLDGLKAATAALGKEVLQEYLSENDEKKTQSL